MNFTRLMLCVLSAAILALPASVEARGAFDRANLPIPNGSVAECNTCHAQAGIPALNLFGTAFLNNGELWDAALAGIDSDADDATNGEELGDPNGEWSPGAPAPGDAADVTNPGDPASKPPVVVDPPGEGEGEGEVGGEAVDAGEGEGEGEAPVAGEGEGEVGGGAGDGAVEGAGEEGEGEEGDAGDTGGAGDDGGSDGGGSDDDGGCFSIAAAGGGGTSNAPAAFVVFLLGAAAWVRRRN